MARTLAERIEKLKTIRDQIEDRIAEITAKPKPDYEIDGQKISWADYLESLTKSLKSVEDQIAKLDRSGELTVTQIIAGS